MEIILPFWFWIDGKTLMPELFVTLEKLGKKKKTQQNFSGIQKYEFVWFSWTIPGLANLGWIDWDSCKTVNIVWLQEALG